MTSFATHDALAEAVAGTRRPAGAAARLAAAAPRTARSSSTPTASPRRTRPGHGDLGRRAAALGRARALPPRTACARSSCATSTTSARRSTRRSPACTASSAARSRRSSSPSAPATPAALPVRRADGSLAIAEAFRVPEDFPHEQFPLFNTNTLWIDVAGARGAGGLHLVRGAQERGRPQRDPVRAPRRRAHLVASVALRPRARATAPDRASCRSRTRTTWRPRRSRSRRSAASGSPSTSDPRSRRGERRVRKLYGSCEAGRRRPSGAAIIRECDQPAHAPQPRPRSRCSPRPSRPGPP